MPAERLLASYIVRVLVRNGLRRIVLHRVGSGETHVFGSYREALAHLTEREEADAAGDTVDPRVEKPP